MKTKNTLYATQRLRHTVDFFRGSKRSRKKLTDIYRFQLKSKLAGHEGCVNSLHFNSTGSKVTRHSSSNRYSWPMRKLDWRNLYLSFIPIPILYYYLSYSASRYYHKGTIERIWELRLVFFCIFFLSLQCTQTYWRYIVPRGSTSST